MTKNSKRSKKGVPTFVDEAEAAAFWDTHSPLDFPEEFEEAELSIARPARVRGLTVRLDQDAIERLNEVAQQKGVEPSTLARIWILEQLQLEPPEPATTQ